MSAIEDGRMSEIWIFGHPPSEESGKFKNESEMIEWMKEGLFNDEGGRYRYTQQREGTRIIVISFAGKILGYFNVLKDEGPNQDDKREFQDTTWVYVIERSNVFEIKNKLSDFVNPKIQFGKSISDETFEVIKHKGGKIETFR